MRARSLLGLAAAAALCAVAAGAQPGALQVTSPPAQESASALPLLEVKGRAGARAARGHDVMIAIDLSASTTAPSGRDLDGDGPDGRTSPALLARIAARGAGPTTLKVLEEVPDLEDSVLFAELLAAEALIDRLDPRTFRVGLVAFSDHARVVAPLGSRRALLRRRLDALRSDFWQELRGTNFAEAVHVALTELRPEAAGERPAPGAGAKASATPEREASILLLSDGAPTLPPFRSRPQQFSIEAAQDAALAGVRVYTFALGPEAGAALDVYRAMAATSGGRSERLEQPADAIARLRQVDLADLRALRVENATNGEAGRALRVFPDGSFDAFVPLAEGANRLRVTAVTADGAETTVERTVDYRPPRPGEAPSPALEAQRRALLEELRKRTREVEAWAEVERGRTVQLRELDLDAAPGSE